MPTFSWTSTWMETEMSISKSTKLIISISNANQKWIVLLKKDIYCRLRILILVKFHRSVYIKNCSKSGNKVWSRISRISPPKPKLNTFETGIYILSEQDKQNVQLNDTQDQWTTMLNKKNSEKRQKRPEIQSYYLIY